MTRLPVPGQDDGVWGTILNDYLSVEHNTDGTLKRATDIDTAKSTAQSAQTTANAAYVKPSSGIPASDLTGNIPQSAITNLTTDLATKANTSSLSTVATSGSYSDLTGKPTIPAAQVNSDWNASSGTAQILNKPTLATVATSGSYSDLSNKPTIPPAGAQALTPTAVKTSAYTAAAGDLVPVDASTAAVTITLPTIPADKSRITIKKIDTSTNAVTVQAGGSDVFNKTGGSTSASLTLQNQAISLQYATSGSIWYVVGDDLPLSSLSGAYAPIADMRALGFFTPDNYGAGALGTDSSAAVQAAFNAAAAFNNGTGGTVMIPRPYDCQGILWPRNVRLIGGSGPTVQSTAGVDPNIPLVGSVLRLYSGANQDLLQTQYFKQFTTGATLTSGISSGTSTIAVSSTAGFPTTPIGGTAAMTLTIESDTVTYTGISGNTFTGCSGVSVAHSLGVSVLLAQTVYQVGANYLLEGITLLGNKANNTSGRCFSGFAKSYTFHNWTAFSAAGDNIFIGQPKGSANSPSQFSNFSLGYAGANNLNLQGTTDSQFVNGLVNNANGSNIVEGANNGNLNFTNVHSWGAALYNWDMQCNLASHVNCDSDGTGTSGIGIRLNAQYVSWDGGNIYGTGGTAGQTLLQIGNNDGTTHTITGCRFRTAWTQMVAPSILVLYADPTNLSTYHNEFGGVYTVGSNTKGIAYGNRFVTSGVQAIGVTGTLVVSTAITNMPSAGSLYLPNGSGGTVNVTYTSFSGSTFTLASAPVVTIPSGTVVWNTTLYGLSNYNQESFLFDGVDGSSTAITSQTGDNTGHPQWVINRNTQFSGGQPTVFGAGVQIIGATKITAGSKTASYTLTAADGLVIFNGSSLTATLPAASTVTSSVFVIKNLNASALTLGGTIDGITNPSLSQYGCMIVQSNGSVWSQIGGH